MKNNPIEFGEEEFVESDGPVGARFWFEPEETVIISRVGVSFISTEQACANVESEIPRGTPLTSVARTTREIWNEEVFSKITTTDERSRERLEQLYTSLYHMHLHPTDKTGENQAWQSPEPYYEDFSLWSLFRCATPLLHILQPKRYTDMIRSLIDTWRHTGYMPDGRSAFTNGVSPGGSSADNVLADAYIKGVREGIDWKNGLLAMLKNADEQPANEADPRDRSMNIRHGRGALNEYDDRGFITTAHGRSVGLAVEYSVNDFCVWQVARHEGSGLTNAYSYLQRSRNWRNHWNPDVESRGYTGFLQPREEHGKHEFLGGMDPAVCGNIGDSYGCDWGGPSYHSTMWAYGYGVHHDMAKLIDWEGGRESFVERLNTFFDSVNHRDAPFQPPSFTTPYLYNFADRQDLTVAAVRRIARERFKPAADGLTSAGGGGAQESWLLWAMIGLYPLTGQKTFLIGSPWFTDLKIDLGDGKTLSINTYGESDESYYVQRIKLNGAEWYQNWISWDDLFVDGAQLDFLLGSEPVVWAVDDVPRSPASGI